ncbi:TonB-dependent receptor [Kordiimonas sp. SCSIO 12603]|uniref:TonB-dependent receptor domain-containing protein n=1 Tax=Kordiimonas sp. SCSIO 12603 TaxID=2829596 RepID=UPI0021029073|nr:TonB-dependent receptor [Kordiimonas sp. SCSIO 12603]UTW58569.1 TonB-dependent receptor [Kordiimonas sp. SCSIO 12603]
MIDNLSLFRRAALLGSTAAIAMGMCSVSVAAQDADDTEVEEVVVTGSRISRPNITSSSPITVLEAEAFDVLGAVDTIDLVNQLPQAFVAQDSSFANGANGTSTLNLRGLGAIRTLVLANGKRLPYGSPTAGGFPSDLNLIPAQLVERVEIVTGGASAVYGSDAIGGVANFILKKDFEGIELDALYGFNQSNNSSDFARQALEAVGEDPVQGSVTDNGTVDISGVIGANLDDGRGNVTAYFRYLDSNGTQQGDRDFARCALVGGASPRCLGSGQGPFPTVFVLSAVTAADGTQIPAQNFSLNGDGSLSEGQNNPFNFNPFNPIRRAIERINAGFSSRYNITDSIEAYADFGYTRSNSPQIIAPSAAFGSTINQVSCDNPLLGDNLTAICGVQDADGNFARDPDGDGVVQAQVRRRFVEGGPRTDTRTLANYRLVYGLRGELDENWNWDAFGQLGRTDLTRLQFNQVTLTNLGRALDIVSDPVTGNPVCRSVVDGTDPSCIPFTTAYDPNAAVDADALRQYVDTPTLTQGSIKQTVFGGTINGDLTDYGFSTPWADDGVAVLFGFEFRRDSLQTQADGTNQSGDLVGSGAAVLPTNGQTEVYDFFTEVQVPIIQGAEFAKELTFTGAYRRSEYQSEDILNGVEGGDLGTDTYAFGLSWAPIDDIRFRVQYQRAIRAPNIGELFIPVNTGLQSASDPCSGAIGSENLTATASQCANTGVTADLFGNIPQDSGQLNTQTGGNIGLVPETSDTFTVGVVIQPEAIPGLSVSLDYYNIDLKDVISTIPAQDTLNNCLTTGNPVFCNNVQRGPDGSLTFFPRELAFVRATNQNIGASTVSGVDAQVAYNFALGEGYGDIAFTYTATYQIENSLVPVPEQGRVDCVGLFDITCTNPSFEYRHIVNVNWQTPWDITVAANWRYFGALDRIASVEVDPVDRIITTFADNGDGDLLGARLGAQNYFDLTVFWDATENVQLRAGVRNLFDNDPPVLPTFGPSPTVNVEANTIAGTYEAGGRFIFFGAKFSF